MSLPVAREEARPFDLQSFVPSLGRSALAGGLAALVGGLAGGIAIRLAMRAVALLDPEATGRLTDAGAVVGAITTEGSLFLVVFGAVFGISIGSVMIVAFAGLIPGPLVVRGVLFGAAMLLVFGSTLVASRNGDFAALASPLANVLLFSSPFVVAGSVAIVVNAGLERRLPAAGGRSRVDQGYVVVGALALLLVLLTLMSVASNSVPPILPLLYLAAVGYGVLRHAASAPWVRTLGRLLLLAVCLVGGALYVAEVLVILGRAA